MRKNFNKVGRLASLAVALALGTGGCAGGNALRHRDIPRVIDYVVANPDARSLDFIELSDRRLFENEQGHELIVESTARYYEGDKIYEMIKDSGEHDIGNIFPGREFRYSTRINDPWSTLVLIRYVMGGFGGESFEVTYQNKESEVVTVGESVKFLGESRIFLDGIPEVVGSLEGINGMFVPFSEIGSGEQGKIIDDYQLILGGLSRRFNRDRK